MRPKPKDNSSVFRGEVVSINTEKAVLKIHGKNLDFDLGLLPKKINVKDELVLTIMTKEEHENTLNKQAKEILNEIMGN